MIEVGGGYNDLLQIHLGLFISDALFQTYRQKPSNHLRRFTSNASL